MNNSYIYDKNLNSFFRQVSQLHDEEQRRLSDGKQTHPNESKGAKEMTEMSAVYAAVTRTVQDNDHGNNLNEPQTSIIYATLEFADNKVAKEEPATGNPRQLHRASASANSFASDDNGPTARIGISRVHAQDENVYPEII